MDIVKEKPKLLVREYKKPIVAAGIAALALCFWSVIHSGNTPQVSRSTLLVGKVAQGNLDVIIEGYGLLRSERQQLLTTATGGVVQEIFLKPGAVVSADSIIMHLRNPELEHKVAEEQQKFAQEKMALSQLELNQKVDMLGERAKLEEEQTKFLSARATREEQKPWAEKGVISKLNFRETELKEALLTKSVEASKNRIQQLQLVHEAMRKIQREKIATQAAALQVVVSQSDQLKVRAGMAGVVQSVAPDVGQSVPAGQQLALIGGTDHLLALIKVPQSSAARIKIGQAATVDTHQDKIKGHVTRVDPAVRDGTVQVEIAFDEALPRSARPELNVDATVVAERLANVLYVERPANARPNASARVFRLDENKAAPIPLTYGADAGRFIQVSGNVKAGDTLILSDMSKYQQAPALVLVD